MQKKPKTWADVQKRYAMLEKMASDDSIASEVIADLTHGNWIRNLIITVLIIVIIGKNYRRRKMNTWESQ